MWAQLITAPLRPGTDLAAAADVLKTFEQPGSGLIREIFMQDQKNPNVGYVLTLFESEEQAREREQNPARSEGHHAMGELMSKILAGPPEFIDLTVVAEWTP